MTAATDGRVIRGIVALQFTALSTMKVVVRNSIPSTQHEPKTKPTRAAKTKQANSRGSHWRTPEFNTVRFAWFLWIFSCCSCCFHWSEYVIYTELQIETHLFLCLFLCFFPWISLYMDEVHLRGDDFVLTLHKTNILTLFMTSGIWVYHMISRNRCICVYI